MIQENIETAILGGGLAGLSAAYHSGGEATVFEKASRPGGLACSEQTNGFVFDYAPHILFPETEYAADLVRELLGDNLNVQARKAYLYHLKYDLYSRFPFQSHLHGLPVDVVVDCLAGLMEVMRDPDRPQPTNYREWIYWRFGRGIAEHLMIPYSERVWTIDPRYMNFDWIDRRVPEPDIETVLRGALHDESNQSGATKEFWYPKDGGIEALPKALAARVEDLRLEQEVTGIDPVAQTVSFSDGRSIHYEHLIYTLPLTALPQLMPSVPEPVRRAIDGLQFNRIDCVNIGINRPDMSPHHWLYFYEDDFIFHRISFPQNFSPATCPPGTSSVCCEVASSDHRPRRIHDHDQLIQEVINGLCRAGIMRHDDEVLAADVLPIDPAYVIYDLSYHDNVKTIHQWLLSQGIHPCGRFGDWEYYNMDHSIMSGKRAAEEVATTDRVT